ncbi:MAG: glycosyltransferase family 2 protein [Syntrophobacteraceae bacterium]
MKLITVALAAYNPDELLLRKQLESIDAQSYGNIELLILDDLSRSDKRDAIRKIAGESIVHIPYRLMRNEVNMGSVRTFEKLTLAANGDFICYCDQDDVWEPYKIERLMQRQREENALLVYSDLFVIDQDDKLISPSFRKHRTRLKHVHGDDAFAYLATKNSVTGCAMMVSSKIAKAATPFPSEKIFSHDHWLAVYASAMGRISYVDAPLVRYRIHANNQLGDKRLFDIYNKADYIDKRIKLLVDRYGIIIASAPLMENQRKIVERLRRNAQQKLDCARHMNLGNFLAFARLSGGDIPLALFELFVITMPDSIVAPMINRLKRSRIG